MTHTEPRLYLAPTGRALPDELAQERARVLADEVLISVIDALPSLVMVLNAQRQILTVNTRLLESLGVSDPLQLIGQRPGEAVGCQHANDGADGCGSGVACSVCGAVSAVLSCQRTGVKAINETRLTIGSGTGQALDLEVTAAPIAIAGHRFVLVAMRDIAGDKRRQALERLFFHDVLNTAGGINGLARLLPTATPETAAEYHSLLVQTTDQLVEEITAQRTLLAAESGDLVVRPEEVASGPLLRQIRSLFAGHNVAEGRHLTLGPVLETTVLTDPSLLRRVLINLVKTALEATAPGGTVTLASAQADGAIIFTVHNPGMIPSAVQLQLFARSFSTKGAGRGLGTWSVKLLGEAYLHGKVSFTSTAEAGTTMRYALPIG